MGKLDDLVSVTKYIGLLRSYDIPKLTKIKLMPNENGSVTWPRSIMYEGRRFEFHKISNMTRAIYADVDYNKQEEEPIVSDDLSEREMLLQENATLKEMLTTAQETFESMGIKVGRIKFNKDNPEPPNRA